MQHRGDGVICKDPKYLKSNADEPDNDVVEQESIFSGLPEEILISLTPAKMQLVNLYLTGNYSQNKIATILGIAPTTVRAWLIDENIQRVIKELQSRELSLIQSDLNALRHKAIDTMEDLLNSNMDNVRFQAAKDILDRGGLKAEQSIKVDKTVTTLEQQLSELAEYTICEDDIVDIDLSDVLEEVNTDG